jgi:hypothetical protein
MILFLRDKNNNTIVDIECYVKSEDGSSYIELHSAVDIHRYSFFLLENQDRKLDIIADFSEIDELRGWLWEKYFMGGTNDPSEYDKVIAELRKMLRAVAKKYDLSYVED